MAATAPESQALPGRCNNRVNLKLKAYSARPGVMLPHGDCVVVTEFMVHRFSMRCVKVVHRLTLDSLRSVFCTKLSIPLPVGNSLFQDNLSTCLIPLFPLSPLSPPSHTPASPFPYAQGRSRPGCPPAAGPVVLRLQREHHGASVRRDRLDGPTLGALRPTSLAQRCTCANMALRVYMTCMM